jgi:hypothetical protein
VSIAGAVSPPRCDAGGGAGSQAQAWEAAGTRWPQNAPRVAEPWIAPPEMVKTLGLAQKSRSANGEDIVFIVHCQVNKEKKEPPRDPMAITVPCVEQY